MTNASALPVQRQVLEQLLITDQKVGFGHASLWWIRHSDLSNIIQCHRNSWLWTTSYITHKTLSSSLILMLLALPTFRSHLYNPYLTLKQILPPWSHESTAKSFQTIYYRFHKFCWWIRNNMLYPSLLHLGILTFELHCPVLPSPQNGSHCCTARHWMLLSWSRILDFVPSSETPFINRTIPVTLVWCFVSGKNLKWTQKYEFQKLLSNWLALPGCMMTKTKQHPSRPGCLSPPCFSQS